MTSTVEDHHLRVIVEELQIEEMMVIADVLEESTVIIIIIEDLLQEIEGENTEEVPLHQISVTINQKERLIENHITDLIEVSIE